MFYNYILTELKYFSKYFFMYFFWKKYKPYGIIIGKKGVFYMKKHAKSIKHEVPKSIERSIKPEKKSKGPITKDDKLYTYLESLLGNEILEDAMQMSRIDEIDVYLESEAHMLAEQEIFSEYELENGTGDGYEDMLEETLLFNMQNEEVDDMIMYQRIYDRINSLPTLEARNAMYERFAPEIMRGRDRSIRLVARMERKLAKARAIDEMRKAAKNRRVSLKPKFAKKDKEREHDGRKKDSLADGYPY